MSLHVHWYHPFCHDCIRPALSTASTVYVELWPPPGSISSRLCPLLSFSSLLTPIFFRSFSTISFSRLSNRPFPSGIYEAPSQFFLLAFFSHVNILMFPFLFPRLSVVTFNSYTVIIRPRILVMCSQSV